MSQVDSPAERQTLASRVLLQSRFGQRLLLLFAASAVVPTCAVAYLSFRGVSGQLSIQARGHLASVASAAGRTVMDRLELLEADLDKAAPQLPGCSRCATDLLYAADEVLALRNGALPRRIAGEADEQPAPPIDDLPDLAPGGSSVFAVVPESGPPRLYLAHRPVAGPVKLLTRINPAYLWSGADADALPRGVRFSLWDPATGRFLDLPSEGFQLAAPLRTTLSRGASGDFTWESPEGSSLAAWWSPPRGGGRFPAPAWRVIVSEPEAIVLGPMAGFRESFPLLLALSLGIVIVLGALQIRRSLIPLAELQQGTRRIAERDFAHRVTVTSGDELEDLAGALNAMSTRLGRQFHALKAAADIDRAVLSSVDAAAIALSVVDRVPGICPCHRLSITLLGGNPGDEAATWRTEAGGHVRHQERVLLTEDEVNRARSEPERLHFPDPEGLPGYLRHFEVSGPGPVDAFPLRYGGELLGVLALQRKPEDIAEDDLLQVRRIADQVAVALSNARMVDQVRFLAFFDSLTRLPNRVLYKERLAQALVRAERNSRFVAVCFIDLDHFSRINDTLGHDLGDVLLQEAAARLLASSRTVDSVSRLGSRDGFAEVSRLGGDEFTVVLSDLADPQEAVRVARRLLESLRQPIRLGTQEVFVTASVGVAIYPFDGSDTEELLKNADVAMYHAKEQGRNTYQLYSASMNAEAMARLQLEHQLRKAVEAGEFTIWYQPIVDLSSGTTVGAEALIRWAHPERGLVSPAEFISLCEECGLIVPLGEWILRRVCTEATAWEAAGLGQLRVSVNLSARQLRHDAIVETVRVTLQETGLRPSSLVLELTESMLMEPRGIIGRTIREIADLGVSLAIDDFGTGYSSLSYLKNFPVSTLKIDRSFIAGITTDPNDAAITTAIIALARGMQLDVVAEGVETKAQAEFLRERGCHKIQGYLMGHPMSVEDFEAGLRKRARVGAPAAS